ncbi:hypothetical protein GIB67_014896 [Kingdonia uniflora]|uniref:Uncharacterized protein n=1 Tax=Kingdonia uniflora TaxID=39325 RepID=A0A7J7MTG5_9MAGN|nr:hypothetical protein GIB67_014896 [Kingdonia uniflora]
MKVLEALKQASQDLKNKPSSNKDDASSSAIKALLELQTEADNILSNDPSLFTLSQYISTLKPLVETLQRSQGNSLRSFLRRRVNRHDISRVAESIEHEIQAWIDRESLENLVKSLNSKTLISEDETIKLLRQFERRIEQGFSRDLQDLVLRSKIFNALEYVLCDYKSSKRIREASAFAVSALVQFNKDVFVGEVLMGPTIRSLISIGSYSSLQVLNSLIRSIKSALVDEIDIPKIITFLSSEELLIKIVAVDCVLEIGYFGRKEAIEAMLKEGLVMKLVELQRSEELGGDLIDMGRFDEGENNGVCVGGVEIESKEKKGTCREKRFLETHPFASCVARFAIQLEVGEGLRQRERRAFKLEILKLVRESCVSDAETATILAEVLWGSTP